MSTPPPPPLGMFTLVFYRAQVSALLLFPSAAHRLISFIELLLSNSLIMHHSPHARCISRFPRWMLDDAEALQFINQDSNLEFPRTATLPTHARETCYYNITRTSLFAWNITAEVLLLVIKLNQTKYYQ